MKILQAVRGMRDFFPPETRRLAEWEKRLVRVLDLYGYGEIRTPLLEPAELFSRSIGEQTDIVEKEMYTFTDRDGQLLTLRPEGTASVVRAFVEKRLDRQQPLHRFYYLGPMFRRERPQKGRFRQFSQLGVELLGAAAPAADVEVIDLLVSCARALGLEKTSLRLNSLGCPACRQEYRRRLVEYLQKNIEKLCADCQRRLQTNPLRVLDCKQPACQQVAEGAPPVLDYLCQECSEHFTGVRGGLDVLQISYRLDQRLVRGLDYYTRTAFELVAEGLGAQNAVAGGGRYDGLVEQLGGPPFPAVGFAVGLERMFTLLEGKEPPPAERPLVFVAVQAEQCWKEAYLILSELRRAGLRAEADVRMGSLKSQFKRADSAGARLVLVLGEEEAASEMVTIKDLRLSDSDVNKQRRLPRRGIADRLSELLSKDIS